MTEGQKHRGSQRWLQVVVNRCPDIIDGAVADAIGLASGETIEWVSPLESDAFREYRDQEFLDRLGVALNSRPLAEFWPRGGPWWDGLARTSEGRCVLKANIPEFNSDPSRASPASLHRIQAAFAETKAFLRVRSDTGWSRCFYQYANRTAHLHILGDALRAGGHGDAGMDAPHGGGNHAGGPVPPGYGAPRQQHMAPQLSPAAGQDPGPQDELNVPGLVLDGDEHRAVLPPGVLAGDGPSRHQDFPSFSRLLHGGGGHHGRVEGGPHELHQVSPGIDAHDPVLPRHLLVGGEVGQPRNSTLRRIGEGPLSALQRPDAQARVPPGLPPVGGDSSPLRVKDAAGGGDSRGHEARRWAGSPGKRCRPSLRRSGSATPPSRRRPALRWHAALRWRRSRSFGARHFQASPPC